MIFTSSNTTQEYLEIKEQINYTMSRKKQPYEHSDFKLQRMNVRGSLNEA
jgi:hypothetical protein